MTMMVEHTSETWHCDACGIRFPYDEGALRRWLCDCGKPLIYRPILEKGEL